MGVEMRGKIHKMAACYCCDIRNGKKIDKYSSTRKGSDIAQGIKEYNKEKTDKPSS